MGTGVAIAGLVVSAAGTVANAVETKKRADIQEEQMEVQSAQQDVEALNQRRKQIRERRVRAAKIEQASEQMGTGGSSGEAGAIGALATNVMANIGMSEGRASTSRTLTGLSQKAADSQTRGALYGAAADLGGAMYSFGEKDFLKLFDE
jgi:hypothetical protein